MERNKDIAGISYKSGTGVSVECSPVSKLIMELNPVNFSKLVKHERKKAKLSQTKFATKLEISLRTLQHIEKGKRLPDLDNTLRILAALGYAIKIQKKLEIQAYFAIKCVTSCVIVINVLYLFCNYYSTNFKTFDNAIFPKKPWQCRAITRHTTL